MKWSIAKAITALVWVAIIINLFQPFAAPADTALNIVGAFLLIAHLIECVVYRGKVAQHHSDNKLWGYVLILLFGVIHINSLKEAEAG